MEWVSSGQNREKWLWSSAPKPLQHSADILGFVYHNSKEVGRSLSPRAKNGKVVPSCLRYEFLCKDTHMTGRSLTAWLVSILLSVLLSVWTLSPWLSYLIGRCTCLHLQHSHACAWPWTLLIWTQTAEWLSGLSSDMSCYYRLAQQSLNWILDPLAEISQLNFGPVLTPQASMEICILSWRLLPSLCPPCSPCLGTAGLDPRLTRTLPCQLCYHAWLTAPYSLGTSRPLLLPDRKISWGTIRRDFHYPLLLVLGEIHVVSRHVLATSFSALCNFLLFAWSRPQSPCSFFPSLREDTILPDTTAHQQHRRKQDMWQQYSHGKTQRILPKSNGEEK